MQVFLNTTGSAAGASVLTSLMLIIGIFSCVAVVGTNSRQLFAFARDNSVPFSYVFGTVSPTLEIPINFMYLTLSIFVILSLIQLGSSVVYMQAVSLGAASMLTSLMVE